MWETDKVGKQIFILYKISDGHFWTKTDFKINLRSLLSVNICTLLFIICGDNLLYELLIGGNIFLISLDLYRGSGEIKFSQKSVRWRISLKTHNVHKIQNIFIWIKH